MLMLKSKVPRKKWSSKNGNVLELPFQGSTFDLVTCSSVLNNLHSDDLKIKALSEIHRVLKPSGRFLIAEPLRSLRIFSSSLLLPFGNFSRKMTGLGYSTR